MSQVAVNIIDQNTVLLSWETEIINYTNTAIHIYGSNWIGDRTDPSHLNEAWTVINPALDEEEIKNYTEYTKLYKSCGLYLDNTYKFYKFVIEEYNKTNTEFLSSDIIAIAI